MQAKTGGNQPGVFKVMGFVWRAAALTFAGLGAALAGEQPEGAEVRVPLEQRADRTLNFEGASVMPSDTGRAWIGSLFLNPKVDVPGTGNQIYFFGIERAFDDWQIGFSGSVFDDQPPSEIEGTRPQIFTETVALHAKRQIVGRDRLQLAGLLSVEAHRFASREEKGAEVSHKVNAIGAVAFPLSLQLVGGLEFQVLPSFAAFPSELEGRPYYGDVASIGAGLSWRLGRRLELYSSYNEPLSGDNNISSDGTLQRVAISSAGARFNVTPRLAIDLLATNGMGVTPATRILAFFPDGNNDMYAVNVIWTPPTATNLIPRSYSDTPSDQKPDDIADESGFTLSSATTLPRGYSFANYWSDVDGAMGGRFVYSPEHRAQLTASLEGFAHDGSVDFQPIGDFTDRWSVGLRLGLLNQAEGAPLSSAVEVSMGRTVSTNARVGTLYVSLPQSWRLNPRVQFNFGPKMAATHEFERYGFGLGLTSRLIGNLLGVVEVTPVFEGEPAVWAAGFRMRVLRSLQLQALATNAVGMDALGPLIAQDSTRYIAGVRIDFPSWTFFP